MVFKYHIASGQYIASGLFCVILSYDQLWAALLIGGNAVTWRWSLRHGRPCVIIMTHGRMTFTKCKHKIYSTLFLFTLHTSYRKWISKCNLFSHIQTQNCLTTLMYVTRYSVIYGGNHLIIINNCQITSAANNIQQMTYSAEEQN